MGDTFNAFVKFISDDPIMLGLCIAIIVLIIAFILVLFLGRKKDDREENIDNTRELLKTDVDMEALKSTQEFSMNELQNSMNGTPNPVTPLQTVQSKAETSTQDSAPTVENSPIEPAPAMEIPITTNEAPVSLEVSNEKSTIEPVSTPIQNPVEPVPVFDSFKVEPPKIEEAVSQNNATNNTYSEQNIFDATPQITPAIEPTRLNTSSNTPIVESVVSPLEPVEIPSVESVFGTQQPKVEHQNIAEPTSKVEMPKMDGHFSAINVDSNAELPTINMNDFSKTEIIKHVPTMDIPEPVIEPKVEVPAEDNLDDVDLPMLNTNATNNAPTNALNSLQGESFNIN